MENRKLTKKQKAFADLYIQTGNGRDSAIKAGYSKRSAHVTASENLTKPNIKKYMKKQIERVNKKTIKKQVDVHDALNQFIQEASQTSFKTQVKETHRYEGVDEEGNPVQFTRESIPIKAADVIRAIELKARLEGLFDEDPNIIKTISIVNDVPNAIGAKNKEGE